MFPLTVALLLGGAIVVAASARWEKAHPVRRSVLHATPAPSPGKAWTRV